MTLDPNEPSRVEDEIEQDIAKAKKSKAKKNKKKEEKDGTDEGNDKQEKKKKKQEKKEKKRREGQQQSAADSAVKEISTSFNLSEGITKQIENSVSKDIELTEEKPQNENVVDIKGTSEPQENLSDQNIEKIKPLLADENLYSNELKSQLLDTLAKQEDRDILSKRMRIVINTIEVAHLPKVHRFVKNKPWLKAQYGRSYAWVADYNGQGAGDQASWSDLQWTFNVEVEEEDRQDLVIAVCSKDVIIGKYVFGKDEFSEIPRAEMSSIFSMSGELINGTGVSGSIEILCHRSVHNGGIKTSVDRPLSLTDELALENVSGPVTEQFSVIYSHPQVFLRVTSIAVMDLRQIHFLEPNSPMVTVDTFEWVGITDIVHHGGVAAGWTNLQWKFAVKKDYGMTVTITSNDKFVGKCFFTTEEILILKPIKHIDSVPVVSLVKTITNGKEITGKLKIITLVNHPDDVYLPPDVISQTVLKDELTRKQRSHSPSSVDGSPLREKFPPVDSESPMKVDGEGANEEPIILDTKSSYPLDIIKEPPFTIHISEITVLDIQLPTWQWLLGKSNIKLHIACGGWGTATPSISTGGGKYAHWLGMNWKIPVISENYHLRCTLWSSNQSIGAATLTIAELLGMPTSRTGRTEIFAKIFSEKNEISGKVRITCRYIRGAAAEMKAMTLNSMVLNTAETLNKESSPAKLDKKALGTSLSLPNLVHESVSESKQFSEAIEELRFPLEAQLMSISLLDLMPVHPLRKNNARITFSCDRKTASTRELKNIGAIAEFNQLNWSMYLRADSKMSIVVDSRGTIIGKAEIFPYSLLEHPMIRFGMSELNIVLKNNEATTGKAIITFKLKSAPIESFIEPIVQDEDVFAEEFPEQFPTSTEKTESPVKKRLASSNSTANSNFLPSISARPTSASTKNPTQLSSNNFRFDPNQLHSRQILENPYVFFNVIVQEIDLFDLKQMHSLAKNSPVISAACGRWGVTSSELTNAGSSGYWTKLNWQVKMKDEQNKLRLTVFSRGKVLGTVQFSISQLLREHITGKNNSSQAIAGKLVEEGYGLRRIQGRLRNEGVENGVIKVAYSIDVVHKQPPAMEIEELSQRVSHEQKSAGFYEGTQQPVIAGNKYNNEVEYRMRASSSVKSFAAMQELVPARDSYIIDDPNFRELTQNYNYSPQIPRAMNREVRFPCTCIVRELAIMELLNSELNVIIGTGNNLHSGGSIWSTGSKSRKANNILIKVQCGNFYQKLQRVTESGEFIYYNNLNWQIPVDANYRVDISICDGIEDKEFGRVRLPVMSLAQLPVANSGLREKLSLITLNGITVGKMMLKLLFITSQDDILRDQLEQSNISRSSNNNMMPSGQSVHEHSRSMFSQKQEERRHSPSVQQVNNGMLLGSMLDQSYMSYGNNQRSVSPTNNPQLTNMALETQPRLIDHFPSKPTTPSMQQSLATRPISAQNTKILNRPPPLPLNTMNITSTPTNSVPRNEGQSTGAPPPSSNNITSSNNSVVTNMIPVYAAGAISNTQLGNIENRTNHHNLASSSRPQSSQRQLLTDRQSLHSNLTDNTSNYINHAVSNTNQELLSSGVNISASYSIDEVGGLRVNALSLIELPKIHTFAQNQPQCAIACGKHTLSTNTSINPDGSVAQWNDLEYEFQFDQKAMLRVLVSSRDHPIGYVNFTKDALMTAKPANDSSLMILGTLMSASGKSTGKVKVTFQLLPKSHFAAEQLN